MPTRLPIFLLSVEHADCLPYMYPPTEKYELLLAFAPTGHQALWCARRN